MLLIRFEQGETEIEAQDFSFDLLRRGNASIESPSLTLNETSYWNDEKIIRRIWKPRGTYQRHSPSGGYENFCLQFSYPPEICTTCAQRSSARFQTRLLFFSDGTIPPASSARRPHCTSSPRRLPFLGNGMYRETRRHREPIYRGNQS